MPASTFTFRARLSFPGESRSLLDTGRLMARWAERIVDVLAPELRWESAVQEHADYAMPRRWQASHVVQLTGIDETGVRRGWGESRLAAGGKGSRLGGTGRIVIETVRPVRHLSVDDHCDVTHWDLRVGAVTRAQLDALIEALEDEIGAEGRLSRGRESAVTGEAPRLVTVDDAEDRDLWLRDLADAGLRGRVDGSTLRVVSAALPDVDALFAARVTLGEILAEAGHEDWEDRALDVLVRIPPSG
ncbi:MAG TPA: hypothetical protein RMH99_08630 [Sandaracinaceae bacterium LLY-WYZ-13_1]|nr:hypothetical protein [Sandaracinaceae bacterium LLY-WYZ-13_1]